MEEKDKFPEGSLEPTEDQAASMPVEEPSAPTAQPVPEVEPIDVGKNSSDVGTAEVYIPEEALAPKKSRGGGFKAAIRKGLIWLLVFALVYLAGAATIYILEYQPTKDALTQTQSDLDQANQQITSLQQQLDQAQLDQSYNTYLVVLSDVYAGRLALLDADTSSAKIYLADAQTNLALIIDDVAAFDQPLADSLTTRLNLVITNIDADIERSIQDAKVLSEDLLKVYDGIYAQK